MDESLDRYRFALRYIEPTSRVLDFPCGDGHGSELVSRMAEDVLAIDPSKQCIQFCRSRYASTGIRFEVGEGAALPVEAGSIDVYLCFETIARSSEPEKLLVEAKRVLSRRGALILSVSQPQKSVAPPDWTAAHFQSLLGRYFSHTRHFAQGAVLEKKFNARTIASMAKRLLGLPRIAPLPTGEEVSPTATLISVCRP